MIKCGIFSSKKIISDANNVKAKTPSAWISSLLCEQSHLWMSACVEAWNDLSVRLERRLLFLCFLMTCSYDDFFLLFLCSLSSFSLLDRVFFLLLLLPTSSTRLLIWLEWSRDLFSDMFWNLNVDIKKY